MNDLERLIHQSLEGQPLLRNSIKFLYQSLCSVRPTKNYLYSDLTQRSNCFYGFHTTSPWSYDNKYLLTHECSKLKNRKSVNEKIDIGYFSGENFTEYNRVTDSLLWNWQQGTMLQWLGDTYYFILNDWIDGKHKSKVIDLGGDVNAVYDVPISAVSPCGTNFVSYSYNRLSLGMKGYGYQYFDEEGINSGDSSGHLELSLVNCLTGEIEKLFSIRDITNIGTRLSFKKAYHFFSHCLYSPSGQNLMFFHRWKSRYGDVRTRVFVLDFHTGTTSILPIGEYVSHASWLNDSELLLYCENKKNVRGYYIVDFRKSQAKLIEPFFIKSDGHPQVLPQAYVLVSDTYPDRFRMQKLFFYDLKNNDSRLLASLKIPLKFRGTFRCDFHPRWDRFGKYVSFDSAHTGVRSHCVMKLNN